MKRIPLPSTLLPLVCAMGLACDGKAGEQNKDAKADAKSGVLKIDDNKAEDGKKADDAKEAADAKAGAEPDAKAADADETPPGASKFRKGQPAPVGMSPEDVKAYAAAQGDPEAGEFTLEEALAGDDKLSDPKAGKLQATFDTTMGKFNCELYEEKAPKTVANFVGLARGVRPSYDKDKDEWVTEPFYDDVVFHRVVKGFMIQTGDPSGAGTGGPGYVIVDETDNGLKHTSAGMLSMANRGPNTGSSQFFVTVTRTPHLDGKHTVFGKCDPEIPKKISEVKVDPRRNHRPYEEVKIKTIEIKRK